MHRAICEVHEAREPVAPATVADKLTERGELARVGGRAYLHACVQAVPTAGSGAHYAEIVRAKAYRRAVIESAQRILDFAYSEAGDEDEIRDLVEQHLTEIIAGTPGLNEAPPTVDALYLPFVADTEAIQDGRKLGLTYGFADLGSVAKVDLGRG
ncbi:DnaB-like helicase N-terminal domain-containing protein [Streptomyces sp. NPDC014846]|uniref:DnaB-like helicase N-terminal domain-containing protein n=1 Tax=Streptomyces sp. NPDC014846 TaxID=3364922 RepID=UPI0036F77233